MRRSRVILKLIDLFVFLSCLQILTALGKSWHPEHFVCSQCSQPITEGSFNQRDGMPVCSPCYVAKFTDICHGCNQPILGVRMDLQLHWIKYSKFILWFVKRWWCTGLCRISLLLFNHQVGRRFVKWRGKLNFIATNVKFRCDHDHTQSKHARGAEFYRQVKLAKGIAKWSIGVVIWLFYTLFN